MAVARRILWLVVPGAAFAAVAAAYAAKRAIGYAEESAPPPVETPPAPEPLEVPVPTDAPDTIATGMEPARVTPVVQYYGSGETAELVPAAPPPDGDPGVEPEPALLERLELELPRERRPSGATLAALAALAGVLAIALGAWAFVSSVLESDEAPVAAPRPSPATRVVRLLAKPTTDRIPLKASVGRIVLAVGVTGEGALVLGGLAPAPVGKNFQAWLIRPDSTVPVSVALFDGRGTVVPLQARVPEGATVAVTLERAGGAVAPTRTPKLLAHRT